MAPAGAFSFLFPPFLSACGKPVPKTGSRARVWGEKREPVCFPQGKSLYSLKLTAFRFFLTFGTGFETGTGFESYSALFILSALPAPDQASFLPHHLTKFRGTGGRRTPGKSGTGHPAVSFVPDRAENPQRPQTASPPSERAKSSRKAFGGYWGMREAEKTQPGPESSGNGGCLTSSMTNRNVSGACLILCLMVLGVALPDRLLHRRYIVNIRGNSYRMRRHSELSNAIHPLANRMDGGSPAATEALP